MTWTPCIRLERLLEAHDCAGLKTLVLAFFARIPYQWYTNSTIANYEGFYAGVFYSYFATLGYDVAVEESSSHGRLDMAVRAAGHVYLFEFKVAEMAPPGSALAQLRERRYADKYRATGEPVHLVNSGEAAAGVTLTGPVGGAANTTVYLAAPPSGTISADGATVTANRSSSAMVPVAVGADNDAPRGPISFRIRVSVSSATLSSIRPTSTIPTATEGRSLVTTPPAEDMHDVPVPRDGKTRRTAILQRPAISLEAAVGHYCQVLTPVIAVVLVVSATTSKNTLAPLDRSSSPSTHCCPVCTGVLTVANYCATLYG